MTHSTDTLTLTNPIDTAALAATAHWAGVDETTLSAALACHTPRLVVSGRLGSGKDTVAEAAMAALGRADAARVSFATALRREVDDLFDAVRRRGLDHTDTIVADAVGATTPVTVEVADLVRAILTADADAHSYQRTREIRLLLQMWGTDVRRAQDESYWSKQGVRAIVKHLAAGRAVYVTDARFVDEVELAKALGMVAVRLEVDAATREARLLIRDGLRLDPAAESHPSEQELERYDGFDLRVDNSGALDDSVAAVCAALRHRFS